MKTIPLSQHKFALVDDADYEWLNQWSWCVRQGAHTFYAVRKVSLGKGKQRTEQMHRIILGLRQGDKHQTDHHDGNGLNNQLSNLRVCTTSQNQRSARKRKKGSSKYKGVCWHRGIGKWHSRIRVNKNRIHLGYFGSELIAARVYDRAAMKHHGQFALTNKMLGLFDR